MDLAQDPLIGAYTGIVVAAIFGCTITFTIPMGIGIIDSEDRPLFAKGILLGLAAMPVALVTGGLLCGLSPKSILFQNFPSYFLLCFSFWVYGKYRNTDPGLSPYSLPVSVPDYGRADPGRCSIHDGVCHPSGHSAFGGRHESGFLHWDCDAGQPAVSEILQRILRRPFSWAGRKAGINDASVAGLLIGTVSVIPALTMLHQMDTRGKVVNVAFLVSAASALATHLGFTMGTEPQLAVPLLAAKWIGGIAGALLALAVTRPKKVSTSAGAEEDANSSSLCSR